MALKDWKKISNHGYMWERKNANEYYVELVPDVAMSFETGKFDKVEYSFFVWKPYRSIKAIHHLTKSEAFKYAKSYMEKH